MKKSEMYKYAQCAVVACVSINTPKKLEVLRELMAQEDLALFVESQEETDEEKNDAGI